MTEENYKTPEADLEITAELAPSEVKRPWFIYLMAIWSFFAISGSLGGFVSAYSQENSGLSTIGYVIVLLITILFITKILQMRRHFLITFGVLCVILTLWHLVNLGGVLRSQNISSSAIYFLLFTIIPSAILAVLALNPSLWLLADKYRKYKQYESMKKASLKALRK